MEWRSRAWLRHERHSMRFVAVPCPETPSDAASKPANSIRLPPRMALTSPVSAEVCLSPAA